MGATNDSVFVQGDMSAEKAYRRACDDALHEHGSDPYNGTITTSSGFRVVQATPVSFARAHEIEEQRIDSLQKWGAWEAIAIASPESFTERSVSKTLRIDQPVLPWHGELTKLVAPQLGLKDGEFVKSLKVEADEPAWRPVTRVPEGERQVVYYIDGVRVAGPNEFGSIAEARKALEDIARKWGEPRPGFNGTLVVPTEQQGRPMQAAVKGKVTRGRREVPIGDGYTRTDDVPLVEVTTEIKSRKVTVAAVIAKQKPGTPKLYGWQFYGWVAT